MIGSLAMAFCAGARGQDLFDATKAEMAGNADWVIDADLHNLNVTDGNGSGTLGTGGQESNPTATPTPAASKITSTTSETYWDGALSTWAITLVKDGKSVSTLPYNGSITYGDASNPQDLSHYKVFVLDEPNILFTNAEKIALLSFLYNGGGLFLISDHTGSDRNNDGADSVAVLNNFLSDGGLNPLGVTINSNDLNITKSSADTSASDPLTHGTAGTVTNLTYHDGASLTISTTANSSVKAAIWTTSTHTNSNVMAAYGTYGAGRFVIIGDSSPADDGTGDSNDTLEDGWNESGAQNGTLITNASLYLAAAPEPNVLALLGLAVLFFAGARHRSRETFPPNTIAFLAGIRRCVRGRGQQFQPIN